DDRRAPRGGRRRHDRRRGRRDSYGRRPPPARGGRRGRLPDRHERRGAGRTRQRARRRVTDGLDEALGRSGPVRSATLGRLISTIERGGDEANEVERAVFPHAGRGYVVGITGAPGAGKSTLTGRLIGELRGRGARVAVLAVDPSSPFSGGAILGDRVRMFEHSLDDGVFIRSMARRRRL